MEEKYEEIGISADAPMLRVQNLKKHYPIKAGLMQRVVGHVKAVDGVSFTIKRGRTLGLVGESGCGKTTVGKTLLRLHEKTDGEVLFMGIDIHMLSRKDLRKVRPKYQMIFQDPFASLSPRLPVAEIIGEAVREHNIVPEEEYNDYLDSIMKSCGLEPYHKDRYPHEFSGGQRQRICIARALALKPSFIVIQVAGDHVARFHFAGLGDIHFADVQTFAAAGVKFATGGRVRR